MERVYWTTGSGLAVDEDLAPFLDDAVSRGYRPYWYAESSTNLCFGISDGLSREVEFFVRGRGRSWRGPLLEVLLAETGSTIRLGPHFGLEESACVVVNGYEAARDVCYCWFSGSDVAAVIDVAVFLNRCDLSPLKLTK